MTGDTDDVDPVVACPCCTFAAPFGRFADVGGCPECERSLDELREAAREVVEA